MAFTISRLSKRPDPTEPEPIELLGLIGNLASALYTARAVIDDDSGTAADIVAGVGGAKAAAAWLAQTAERLDDFTHMLRAAAQSLARDF